MNVQADCFKSHNHYMKHSHDIYDPGHSHSLTCDGRGNLHDESTIPRFGHSGFYPRTDNSTTGISIYDYDGNTSDRGDSETRPINLTYIIWKRIS